MKALYAVTCCFGLLLTSPLAKGVSGGYDYPAYQEQMREDSSTHGYSGGGDASYDAMMGDYTGGSDSSSAWVWPTMSYLEVLGPMKYSKGSGHAQVTSWTTSFDFVHMKKGRWGFNADGAFRMTWVDSSRDAYMDVDRLYTIWTNLNITYRLFGSTRLIVAVMPQWSSDFDSWVSENFYLGAHAVLSGKLNDNVRYVAGAAYAPQFGDSPWIPYVGVTWKLNDRWTLDLMAPRIALKNKVSEGFTWGPFFSIVSGTWTVKRNRRHERFEWRSCALGVFAETGLGQWGEVHPVLLTDVGVSCWNRGRFKSSSGNEEYASYRFEPGFYMRVGLQLKF